MGLGRASHRQADEALLAMTPRIDEVLRAFDREQYWRAKGEAAIRAEMELRLARRQPRRRAS